MYTITTERPEDGPQIENLLDRSFGPNRHEKVSYRYRDGIAPVDPLCLVARADGCIVGTLRYWPVALEGYDRDPAPPLLLGPLAVDTARQGQGIGLALMQASLDMAAWGRHPLAVLVGALDYYAKAGFVPATPYGITMPGEAPERVLVKPLQAGFPADRGGPLLPWRCLRGGYEGACLTPQLAAVA